MSDVDDDVIDNKFSKLTIIKTYMGSKHKMLYDCKCDCDNEKVCIARELRNGSVITCGRRISRYYNVN